jgi:hypothetical protein
MKFEEAFAEAFEKIAGPSVKADTDTITNAALLWNMMSIAKNKLDDIAIPIIQIVNLPGGTRRIFEGIRSISIDEFKNDDADLKETPAKKSKKNMDAPVTENVEA